MRTEKLLGLEIRHVRGDVTIAPRDKFLDQASRQISITRLNPSRGLHL